MRKLWIVGILAFLSAGAIAEDKPALPGQNVGDDVTQGALRVVEKDGAIVECPLKHTDVVADVSGFIARVRVTQKFCNPLNEKIEAVYVFPLPHGSAVDDMTMVIGDRRIVGVIKKREEARQIYEQAIAAGQTAALLEQERPNVFVQSVGNINPNQEINIEVSYLDVLEYDMGEYTFHFPMVVGPRYNPDGFTGGIGAAPRDQAGQSGQKTEVAYLKPGERNGHDISLSLILDAGVPVKDLKVTSHKAEVLQVDKSRAKVVLLPGDSIPNKDFVLKYNVAGEEPEVALLAHNPGEGSDGYFMLMIQPRLDDQLKQSPPREICFLIDVSGSMRGTPTDKVREAMREFFKLSKPEDTMQVVTFASQSAEVFPTYVPATKDNVDTALAFTNAIDGSGGTEMLKGINKVVEAPVSPERIRIVIMLTDGYIGNEAQIIDEVGRKCGDQIRFWTIGIGASPNRFLLDGVAKQGGGMSAVLGLSDKASDLVPKIAERIHRAQLAKINIDWGRLSAYETYPDTIPDLLAGRPVVLFGRYAGRGADTVTINGTAEGTPASYGVSVQFPARQPLHGVLGTTWARKKIDSLTAKIPGGETPELVDEITRLALTYRIMTQYTSFVAVEEKDAPAEPGTPPRRIQVPVPMPEGVSWGGVFGGVGPGAPGHFHGVYGSSGGSGARKGLIRYGGTSVSESTVVSTGSWLARVQEPDGHWDSVKWGAKQNCDTAVTGLALLAFLAHGETDTEGSKYHDNVRRALEWLEKQAPDGSWGTADVQGICTMAMCEAYGLTKNARWGKAAQRAVGRLLATMDTNGGWDSKPDDAAKPRTGGTNTPWCLMAVKSAIASELTVPADSIEKMKKWLREAIGPDGIARNVGGQDAPGLTAAATLGRLFFGWPRDDADVQKSIAYLSKQGPDPANEYYCYYGTMCMFQIGGQVWDQWNKQLRDPLIKLQVKGRGPEFDGSWDQAGRYGGWGGRVYQTAITVLTLEIYYRFLPMLK